MSPQPVTASALKQQRALRKKKLRKYGIFGAGGLVFAYLIYLLFMPYKGGITYGICKIFLEQQVPYPAHLRLSSVEDMGAVIRIWFTQLDSFGEYRLEALTCTYRAFGEDDLKKYGNQMPFVLSKASINRREIDAAVIDRFNYSIPAIIAAEPDLTLPNPLPDSLRDLQNGPNTMMKPIF